MAQVTTVETKPELAAEQPPGPFERVLILLSRYREASVIAIAILLIAFFQARNTGFLSTQEMSVVLSDAGRIGLIAAAEVLVMITGEIDLSVGAVYVLSGYLMLRMSNDWGLPMAVTSIISLGVGTLIGFINGFVTVKLRVPSLITTLGMSFFIGGSAVTISNSLQLDTPSQEPFNEIFGENLYGPLDSFFSWHGLTGFTPFLWALLAAGILVLVLTRTTFGLHTIATGSNLLGAREIGVRTDRIKISNFMIVGSLAAIAGMINTIHFNSAVPAENGGTTTLQAIAAAVIGGTSLFGGSGTAIGALIGAFVVATLNDGLTFSGAQANQSDIYLGAAIVAAMILNVRIGIVRLRRRP